MPRLTTQYRHTTEETHETREQMIHTTISKIIKGCQGITQAAIANVTSINRGQLNTWLKNGKHMSDGNIALIIYAVLDLTAEHPDKAQYQAGLAQLRQDPNYQRDYSSSSPNTSLIGGHSAYIPRVIEPKIEQRLRFQPFDIAILGGLKMGKTSCLNWLTHRLAKKHHVLRLDCKTCADDPLAAIAEAAKQLPGANTQRDRLTSWGHFPDWARRHLITGKKPTTLLFDHLGALSIETLQGLQDGLHHLINQRRVEPVLDQLNLVLAYDESSPAMRDTRDYASGLMRDLTPQALSAFTQYEVAQLLQAILGLGEGIEFEHALEFAWTHFAGHPFLTHYWAHIVSEKIGSMNLEPALNTMRNQVQDQLFQPLQHNLDDRIKTALQDALLIQSPNDPLIQFTDTDLSRQHLLWLLDSGLFVAGDGPPNTSVQFSSSWVQAQFLKATTEAQHHG